MKERPIIIKSIFDLIGNTPLLDLSDFIDLNGKVFLYAKAEWLNPGGSIKDRAAKEIILQAEERGELNNSKRILDATSGNMGIAYSLLGKAKGYKVTLCLPANVSPERKRLLKIFGAELIFTDPLEGIDGAILKARELYERNPERYYYADQYSNVSNYLAHYKSTGPEIWEQTLGKITHFVAGLGTSGTMMGVGRFLKQKNPNIKLVGVQPDSPLHGIEGLKHMESAIKPSIFQESLLDDLIYVSTEEAYYWVKTLLKVKGYFVGVSSGAALAGAIKLSQTLKEGVIVTVFPDGGFKYMHEAFWEDGR